MRTPACLLSLLLFISLTGFQKKPQVFGFNGLHIGMSRASADSLLTVWGAFNSTEGGSDRYEKGDGTFVLDAGRTELGTFDSIPARLTMLTCFNIGAKIVCAHYSTAELTFKKDVLNRVALYSALLTDPREIRTYARAAATRASFDLGVATYGARATHEIDAAVLERIKLGERTAIESWKSKSGASRTATVDIVRVTNMEYQVILEFALKEK